MILELHNIYKTYIQGKMEVPVLKDISLSVDEGEYVAIMGPSGIGKTTLLRMIAGFEKPDSGSIYLNGRCVAAERVWVRPHQRGIGFVPQDGLLFPHLTVAKNIALGLSRKGNSGNQIDDMLQLINMPGMGQRYPHELSGGQRQRVALARALVTNPKVMLADEPTGNLDRHTAMSIFELLNDLRQEFNMAMLIVTHDEQLAQSADKILHMQDGLWQMP